jgi:hypothetical protein
MSIKGAIKRLEGVLARNSGSQQITFLIPHCKNPDQTEKMKTQLINEHGLSNKSDALLVFVVDFAMHT